MKNQPTSSEPKACAKCGASELRRELLTMYGKLGVSGLGYRFTVHICQHCGYSEIYFANKTWWV